MLPAIRTISLGTATTGVSALKGKVGISVSRERDTLGSFMRAMRNQNEDTQRELAERLGNHIRRINKIENGHLEPTMADIVCIARAFGCNPTEIYRAMNESLTRASEWHPPAPPRPRSRSGKGRKGPPRP